MDSLLRSGLGIIAILVLVLFLVPVVSSGISLDFPGPR